MIKRRLASLPLVLLACAGLLLPAVAKAGPALSEPEVEALFLLRHPRGLNHFVRAVSDPASPSYRDYASVGTLVRRFGASKEVRSETLRWLARHDLRGTVAPTHAYVTAVLPRRSATRLLPAVDGAQASGPGGLAPAVPAPLRGAVTRVALLSTRPAAIDNAIAARRPDLAAKPKKKGYSSIMAHSGTAGGCAAGSSGGPGPPLEPFTPNQYLTAYGRARCRPKGCGGRVRRSPWSRSTASATATSPPSINASG